MKYDSKAPSRDTGKLQTYNLPAGTLSSPRLRLLLVRNLLVEMRVGKCSHASLLLAHGLLPVPALEEDLLGVGVEETNHPEVGDDLGPRDVQLQQVGAVAADLVEEHVVRNVPLQGQLSQVLSTDCK